MSSFVVRAHSEIAELHGRQYSFERPVFATRLPGASSSALFVGLYVSVENCADPDEKAYLLIRNETLKPLMYGWADDEGSMVEFARQNEREIKRLVLNIDPAVSIANGGRPHRIERDGMTLSIYELTDTGASA